jgi:hypothetical protein
MRLILISFYDFRDFIYDVTKHLIAQNAGVDVVA